MTNEYDKNKFYSAIVDAISYNIGFKFFEDTFYKPFSNLKDGEYFSNINQYWCIFVLMFGDFGTSPRDGWIIKNEESKKFFENLYNDLKELD